MGQTGDARSHGRFDWLQRGSMLSHLMVGVLGFLSTYCLDHYRFWWLTTVVQEFGSGNRDSVIGTRVFPGML